MRRMANNVSLGLLQVNLNVDPQGLRFKRSVAAERFFQGEGARHNYLSGNHFPNGYGGD